MELLRYKPTGFFRLDDAAPFDDYSGYGLSATLTGTAKTGLALTSDASYSQFLNSTTTVSFPSSVYSQGKEAASFSLCATVYPVVSTTASKQQILSNQNIYDGLTINGTVISFATEYAAGGQAVCSYDLGTICKADVVGVHTREKNSLFVNGKLVAEKDVNFAQLNSTYLSTNGNLYSGLTAGAQGMLINNVAMFNKALQPEEIYSIYIANNKRATGSVPLMFGGEDVLVSDKVRIPYLNTGWNSEEDWKNANLNNVTVDEGQLVATMSGGGTLAGTWTDSVDLYAGAVASPLNSLSMWWESASATIEASVDGTTWAAVSKGQNISVIPNNFDPTNKALYIRISFPELESEAYVDNMSVKGYLSNTATSNNRVVTFNNPVTTLTERVPGELMSDWGSRIGTGGSIVIAPDAISQNPMAVRTIEVWIRPETSGMNVSATGTFTSYVNGQAAAISTARLGEWSVIHLTAAANVTSNITISGGSGTVGKVALYDTALSAGQIASVISNYTGITKTRQTLSSLVSIAESPTSTTVYAHDWEIQSS